MTEEKIGSVNDEKQLKDKESGVNRGRHQAQCTICSHPNRLEIEERWIGWSYTNQMAREYGVSRDSIYRHMHAFDLFSKRRRNIRMALEQIIERVDQTGVNGSGILTAIKLYVKMNSAGQGVEPVQGTNPKALLERMSREQREAFVREGSLPDCFSKEIGATPIDSQTAEKTSEVTENKRLQ